MTKCFLKLDSNHYICLSYIQPDNYIIHRHDDFDFYSVIEDDIYHFSTKDVVYLYGDLNSTTGENLDNVDECYDLDRFVDSAPSAAFDVEDIPQRASQDKETNASGNRLLQWWTRSTSPLCGANRQPVWITQCRWHHDPLVKQWPLSLLLSMTHKYLLSMTYHCYCLWHINLKGVREKTDCTDIWVIKPINQVSPSSGFWVPHCVRKQDYVL